MNPSHELGYEAKHDAVLIRVSNDLKFEGSISQFFRTLKHLPLPLGVVVSGSKVVL